ncbi:RNA ligase [Mycobacteroides abscessus subsp. abscessus]|uniref:RNA ligase family protein n=1 Tax=Mycobacteroides abscessus TaxID=36809 RepID=UPI0009A66FC7|nr:RNA ligase family protein [Mycobacteroides abscessus]SKV08948.1 RNA ligase [Mycobacteroides abscessus subsp. abscessus]SKY70576.1 RNA ligase [Mycobacteroides abscessus subsp. abscessus]
MKFETPKNVNYAAVVVRVPEPLRVLGLDNLVAIPMFGYQVLTQKEGIKAGDLRVLFVAETQLSEEYARLNNLHREPTLNDDAGAEAGYLEANRRVKAIRLRKNNSSALLMPLESLAYTGIDVSQLEVGDTFDTLNGHEICRKYEVPGKRAQGAPGQPKIRQRVDQKLFPMHLDTEHLFRNWHVFREPKRVVVTQKLHGTSIRIGRVPAARDKGWLERVVVNKWLRIATPDTAFEDVAGSRRVVKGRSENNNYYDSDIWADYAKRLEGLIPENFIVYGELIGWESEEKPIQKGYTYNLLPGDRELYVYRVATVNGQGVIADLSWEGVEQFCAAIGVKTVPVIHMLDEFAEAEDEPMLTRAYVDAYLDRNLADKYPAALPLSDPLSVDEGICVRVEGQVPRIFKAKSPIFFEHETKMLDKGEEDLEAAA